MSSSQRFRHSRSRSPVENLVSETSRPDSQSQPPRRNRKNWTWKMTLNFSVVSSGESLKPPAIPPPVSPRYHPYGSIRESKSSFGLPTVRENDSLSAYDRKSMYSDRPRSAALSGYDRRSMYSDRPRSANISSSVDLHSSGNVQIPVPDTSRIFQGALTTPPITPEQAPVANASRMFQGAAPKSPITPEQASVPDASRISQGAVPKSPITPEQAPVTETIRIFHGAFPTPPMTPEHFENCLPESPTRSLQTISHEKPSPLSQEGVLRSINKVLPPRPYHVFDRRKKHRLVFLIAFAGVLSPLSMNIYFTSLTAISNEFEKRTSLVLLTIAIYIAIQGSAPFLLMPLCNTFGRRPLLIITLFIFLCSNIGLLFSHSIVSLTFLRALQSLGTAALSATCTAIIGDISTGEERNKFITIFGNILMFTFIAPIFGGLLTASFGWRAIFWFLGTLGLLVFISVILFLPETLRSIAEDGNVRLGNLQRPLSTIVNRPPKDDTLREPFTIHNFKTPLKFLSAASFTEPIQCLKQKDVLVTIIFGAVVFAVCTSVIVTTTTLFNEHHKNISASLIGFAFLPGGAGSVLSFFGTSYLSERDLRITKEHYRKMHRLESDISIDPNQLPDFPIERARLRNMWWITIIFIVATACYGYTFGTKNRGIAGPLIIQFIIASSATSILLMNGILINDLFKSHISSTLAVNCVRSLTAALAVGTVELFLNKIGPGHTFVVFACFIIAVTPIPISQWFFGKPWVARRNSTWPRQRLMRLPEWESSREKLAVKVRSIRGVSWL